MTHDGPLRLGDARGLLPLLTSISPRTSPAGCARQNNTPGLTDTPAAHPSVPPPLVPPPSLAATCSAAFQAATCTAAFQAAQRCATAHAPLPGERHLYRRLPGGPPPRRPRAPAPRRNRLAFLGRGACVDRLGGVASRRGFNRQPPPGAAFSRLPPGSPQDNSKIMNRPLNRLPPAPPDEPDH
ncbi:MAG TPA: hypothetical protein VH599_09370 [Ktedonobacterales bacterium]|jgi:hypothetical protein